MYQNKNYHLNSHQNNQNPNENKGEVNNPPNPSQSQAEKPEEKKEKPKDIQNPYSPYSPLNQKKEQIEYNEKGFDYSKLKLLLSKAAPNKENIILLTTGSFNPIHRMHLEILHIAYKFLLSQNYNVLCSFISPSADCYVKHKQPPTIPFDVRCEIVQRAIEEYQLEIKDDEFKIFLHTWEGTQNTFIDFPYVIEEIQEELIKYKSKLVYVCGLDLFVKCAGYSLSKNVIAIDRKPYKNKKFIDNPKRLIYIIKDDKAEPFSSTSIKQYYLDNNYKEIERATFRGVAKMIIDYYTTINFKK